LDFISLLLILMGFFVGILSGFFGFGGGFILTPFLISLGFPANISVGTSITEIFMSSIFSSLRHKRLGNLNIKIGLIVAFTSIFSAEIGAQIIEYLKNLSIYQLNIIINLIYVIVLGLISLDMAYDSLRSKRTKNFKGNFSRRHFNKLEKSETESNASPPDWALALIGFIGGFFAGFLGAGGGFLLIPLLIYIIKCEHHIAAGTCNFVLLLSCAYASFTHFFKGNIDFISAALLLSGSIIGSQIGALATRQVKGAIFKAAFSFCLGSVSISIALKLISILFDIFFLNLLSQLVIFSAASSIAILILILFYMQIT